MTSPERDHDEVLRRVLNSAVDAIEPAGDGLARIRKRLDEPWLKRQLSLLLIECVDFAWLAVVRCQPLANRLWAWLASAARTVSARLAPLRSRVPYQARRVMRTVFRRYHGATGPDKVPGPDLPPWVRYAMKLRPVLAMAGAVVIVVAGVYALAQVSQTISQETYKSKSHSQVPSTSPAQPSGPASTAAPSPGGAAPGHPSSGAKSASSATQASPTAQCTSSPPSPSPTPTTSSPSPTPTSASPSPTGQTPSPTPSDTSATTPLPDATGLSETMVYINIPGASGPCTSSSPGTSASSGP